MKCCSKWKSHTAFLNKIFKQNILTIVPDFVWYDIHYVTALAQVPKMLLIDLDLIIYTFTPFSNNFLTVEIFVKNSI